MRAPCMLAYTQAIEERGIELGVVTKVLRRGHSDRERARQYQPALNQHRALQHCRQKALSAPYQRECDDARSRYKAKDRAQYAYPPVRLCFQARK